MSNLHDALQETGCAIVRNETIYDIVHSVERLTDDQFLRMTRRGVCIIGCEILTRDELDRTIALHFKGRVWTPARVRFVEHRHALIMQDA